MIEGILFEDMSRGWVLRDNSQNRALHFFSDESKVEIEIEGEWTRIRFMRNGTWKPSEIELRVGLPVRLL